MGRCILIIDDHPVVLFGLRFLFRDDRRFTIAAEAADVIQAKALATELQPDLIILDLVLGGRDGLELLRELLNLAPRARILIYSSQNERLFARKCASLGAWGYVPKSAGLPIVKKAISAIASGRRYFEDVRGSESGLEDFPSGDATPPGLDQLSGRELQVLRMIGEGETRREIAGALGLSVKTVGTYRERIKTKLVLDNVRDLDEAGRDFVAGRLG